MSTLLHITDMHLYADSAAVLKGISPQESFAAVLAHAQGRFPSPGAILLGGDMAQDEASATYLRIADMLQGWQAPFMVTPGNHANITALNNNLIPALAAHSGYSDSLQLQHWQVITLNSHAQGKVAGLLGDDELAKLDRLLAEAWPRHTLIALHHHPVPIASRWLDEIGLDDRQQLWHIIDRYTHVKALLCGHIHQEFDSVHNHVRVIGTPSSCVQFRPRHDGFALDGVSPGYRWLKLQPDGGIDTGVERVDGFIPVDLENNTPY
jgi:Icc protein